MKDFIKSQIEENQIVVNTVQAQVEELGHRRVKLEDEIKEIRESNLQGLFGGLVEEFGIKPKQNYEGSYVFSSDDKPHSDLFTIYSRKKGWSDEEFEKSINFYTTICDNDFEFNRLIALGRVTEAIKAFSAEELFKAINSGTEELKEQDDVLKSEQNALNKVKSAAERAIKDSQYKLLELELESINGVQFQKPFYLEMGRKINSSDVVKVKVVKKSSSGKTAEVEITSQYKTYDSEAEMLVKEYTRTYERVNLEDLIINLSYYKNKELAKTAS